MTTALDLSLDEARGWGKEFGFRIDELGGSCIEILRDMILYMYDDIEENQITVEELEAVIRVLGMAAIKSIMDGLDRGREVMKDEFVFID